MFTAALRPRCYYALTLNQWWCDKLISCAVIVIVLHTFFQALPWQRRWKGLPAQCFFFVIVILFLIAYYLNICLKMKTEINHNRKKDKKKKRNHSSDQSGLSRSAAAAAMLCCWIWICYDYLKPFFFFSLFWSVWFQHPGQALWEEFSSWLTRLPLCFVGLLIPNDTIFWQWDSTLITCGLSHEDDQLLLLLFSLFLPQSTYSVFLLTL